MAKSTRVVGLCALCERTRILHRSHIIPEFCYVGYDHLHRMSEVHRQRPRLRTIQKGYREPLLCQDCEQRLNDEYEKPMKAAWFDRSPLPPQVTTAEVLVTGLSYSIFKMFHLSVLWRAAVASGAEYGPVRLPPKALADLRRRLYDGDPGLPPEYPVLGLLLLLPPNREPAFDIIQSTSFDVFEQASVYRTVYGACTWQVWVGAGLARPELQHYALTLSGSILLPAVDAREYGPIGRIWAEHVQSTNRSKPQP